MKRIAALIRFIWICGFVWFGCMTLLLTPKESRFSETENRTLEGIPALSFQTVADGSFMSGIETWLSEGVILRNEMIRVSETVEKAFSVSKSEDEETEAFLAAIEAEADAPEESLQPEQETDGNQTLEEIHETTIDENPIFPDIDQQKSTGIESKQEAAETDRKDPVISETTFWIRYKNGDIKTLYSFPVENVQNAASVLNQYRILLPADGKVVYACIPVAATGNAYIRERDVRESWGSDMEAELQKIVSDGVYIVNASEAILPALQRGEYVYFKTDHHWTPLGAHYIYAAMMKRLGIPAMDYHDYEYDIKRGMGANKGVQSDTLEVIREILPTHSYVVRNLTDRTEIPYMYTDFNGYVAILGGTKSPWRQFETGAQTGRTALLIGDSFSNALLPYLLPHYDRVMMTDLRNTYYRPEEAGASIARYIETYQVDDVYFMFCFATSINSYMFVNGQMTRYLH